MVDFPCTSKAKGLRLGVDECRCGTRPRKVLPEHAAPGLIEGPAALSARGQKAHAGDRARECPAIEAPGDIADGRRFHGGCVASGELTSNRNAKRGLERSSCGDDSRPRADQGTGHDAGIAVISHTRPDARTPDLCRVVYVGWQIADQLGFSATGRPVEQDLQAIVSFLPGDAGAKLLQKYDGLAEEVAFKINAVECSLL